MSRRIRSGETFRKAEIDALERKCRRLRREMGELSAHMEFLKKTRAPETDISVFKEIRDDQWLAYCSTSAQIRELEREERATAA